MALPPFKLPGNVEVSGLSDLHIDLQNIQRTLSAIYQNLGGLTAGVLSFNGRSGVVVPVSGDYTVSEVTGAAPLASPVFTGTPEAPTPTTSDNSTKLATTAFVKAQGGLSSALPSAELFVGNGVGLATAAPLSGDATLANTGALTLNTVNATTGTFGDSTHVAQVTVNGKGLVTAVTNVAITAGSGTVNSGTGGQLTWYPTTGTTVGGNANANISNGDLTLGINGSVLGALTLANSGVGGAGATIQNLGTLSAYNFNLPTAAGTSGQPLLSGGGVSSNMTFGTLGVAGGGTGAATLTAHAVLLGEGTGTLGFATIGTSGRLLLDQGASADPSFNAMSGDVTITNAGATTVGKLGGASLTPGTWTPTDASGAGLTFSGVSVNYTQTGNIVHVYGTITWPVTVSGLSATIAGLPVAVPNHSYAASPGALFIGSTVTSISLALAQPNSSTFVIFNQATNGPYTNANLSGLAIFFFLSYPAA